MFGTIVGASGAIPAAYQVWQAWRTATVVAANVNNGVNLAVSAGTSAAMFATSTFVSYFGVEAYKSVSSAIHYGIYNHAKTGNAVIAHSPPHIAAPRNAYDNSVRARVFIAGIVSIIFQWIQYQGAVAMRERTIIETTMQNASTTMKDVDKRRFQRHGIEAGRQPMFLETYQAHPYYRGDGSYFDFKAGSLDVSSVILRPILNVLVGVSVQVENVFFQTGNFDHLHFLSNLFQSVGLYEIIVHSLRRHDWSLIQSALTTFLKTPKQINARHRR
jgi:hypothetical protein